MSLFLKPLLLFLTLAPLFALSPTPIGNKDCYSCVTDTSNFYYCGSSDGTYGVCCAYTYGTKYSSEC